MKEEVAYFKGKLQEAETQRQPGGPAESALAKAIELHEAIGRP